MRRKQTIEVWTRVTEEHLRKWASSPSNVSVCSLITWICGCCIMLPLAFLFIIYFTSNTQRLYTREFQWHFFTHKVFRQCIFQSYEILLKDRFSSMLFAIISICWTQHKYFYWILFCANVSVGSEIAIAGYNKYFVCFSTANIQAPVSDSYRANAQHSLVRFILYLKISLYYTFNYLPLSYV